ncbi:hypothetical protein K0M31_015902 [Melipona bicolor]|uniref:Uncharacterized protein n=1 Tax=Melipona bicolor TaxID=60889 RepID=A0AA40KT26_9HYME|nr:hypothetical protein K0M31_015902 [Melipona bicolor]
MEWNGMELQGSAGGSVTDRPTDRLLATPTSASSSSSSSSSSGERARRKRRRTRDAEGFPRYFVSEVVLVSLLAVS